jgi:hypothetical protein
MPGPVDGDVKMSNKFRKILLIVIVFLLAAALPSTIRELMKTGHIYLFSKQCLSDLFSRFVGPGRFRFLIQPAVATLLGMIGGKKDAAAGRPPYLWSIVSREADWKEAIQTGFDTISNMLLLGILADIVFQYTLFGIVHIVPALLLGPILITAPYLLARGTSNRIFRSRQIKIKVP